LDNLHKFKYAGSDTGIFMKIFWNPLAIWCVDHTSEKIAPNIITLFGFLFTFGPFMYCITVYGTQIGDNAEQLPSWLIFVIGISYFFYRLLDEMDGKQARKTGNSSPLGLLFDHGCDSWTISFMVWMFCKAMICNGG